MKKFKATPSWAEITGVEVLRETEACVFLESKFYTRGTQAAKMSEHTAYFDTFQEARAHSIAQIERGIATLTRQLEREQEKLQKIKEMTTQ